MKKKKVGNSELRNFNSYERNLSAFERMHLKQPNANVVMVAQIKGIIRAEHLKIIINDLIIKHPLIKVKIKFDNRGNAKFVTSRVESPSIDEFPRKDDNFWKTIVKEEISEKFNIESGPLIRFKLLVGKELIDLIITSHHSICDGLSIVFLIRDILELISAPQESVENRLNPPELNENSIPVSVSGGILKSFIMKLINKKWEKEKSRFERVDFDKLHEQFWVDHNNNVHVFKLDSNVYSKLIHKSQKKHVSVSSILIALILKAHNSIALELKGNHESIISVDFRDYLKPPAKETFGKFASAIRPKLEYDTSISFWENAQKINEKIHNLLKLENIFQSFQLNDFDPNLIDAFWYTKFGEISNKFVEKFLKKMHLDEVYHSFILTNLGKIQIEKHYGNYILNSIHGPYIYSDTIEKYFGVITLNEEMFISISYGENTISTSKIIKLKNRFLDHLEEMLYSE
ncbi:MAG: putative Condensation domain-containing protein [Promethearchaeota archaeon]|nr:MAG: putative Condensation domain-containing protein [Candidatus Lokiarchaeota archaeon]